MKKWSEIRQGIITKLFMDEKEVNSENENYASKFAYFANECLVNIANGVKPKIATFKPVLYEKSTYGVNFRLENGKFSTENAFGDVTDLVPDTRMLYIDLMSDKKYIIKDEELLDVTDKDYYVVNTRIRLPEDFLSFADTVNYVNGVADPAIVYLNDKTIMLNVPGVYQIFYNALWEPITEDYMNDQEQPDLPIDQSVLNCIPTYVAAQILAEDDVQRSTILKNEYELMLSRLDTNIMYQENHYKSTGGWY
jgi:hypothetical protein